MSGVGIALAVILAVISVILMVIILLQSNRAAGLGAIGGADSSSYWSKNKGNSVEGALEKYTKILGALFIIIALIINFIG